MACCKRFRAFLFSLSAPNAALATANSCAGRPAASPSRMASCRASSFRLTMAFCKARLAEALRSSCSKMPRASSDSEPSPASSPRLMAFSRSSTFCDEIAFDSSFRAASCASKRLRTASASAMSPGRTRAARASSRASFNAPMSEAAHAERSA
eukprot:Skav226909  [mRNA]  locus=scaffold2328:25289:25747:+ [translate_table: standard]